MSLLQYLLRNKYLSTVITTYESHLVIDIYIYIYIYYTHTHAHTHNTISVWTTWGPNTVPEDSDLPFYNILSSLNVSEMGSHWVLFLLYLNIVLNWLEDGRLRPKHVAKYNVNVIIASCPDVCCVLTVYNISYKFDNTQRDGLSQKKKNPVVYLWWSTGCNQLYTNKKKNQSVPRSKHTSSPLQ